MPHRTLFLAHFCLISLYFADCPPIILAHSGFDFLIFPLTSDQWAKTLDLWPQGIGSHRIQAPVTILRSQAGLLGEKTSKLVQGDVISRNESSRFEYILILVAPALSRYTYQLLTIRHEISLYPVEIEVEPSILKEFSSSVETKLDQYDDEVIVAKSEEEFINILRLVFQSRKVLNIITSLISQSDPNWEEDIPF